MASEKINSRDLSKLDIAVVMIDGIGFGDRTVVAAKAITSKGKKHIIGLVEGDTENSEVVKDCISPTSKTYSQLFDFFLLKLERASHRSSYILMPMRPAPMLH